jgi:hypothetical protein
MVFFVFSYFRVFVIAFSGTNPSDPSSIASFFQSAASAELEDTVMLWPLPFVELSQKLLRGIAAAG